VTFLPCPGAPDRHASICTGKCQQVGDQPREAVAVGVRGATLLFRQNAAAGRRGLLRVDGQGVHRRAGDAGGQRLLAHTNDPVGAIGASLGFSETTNFVKYFQRYR
jgi:hypothetical protein